MLDTFAALRYAPLQIGALFPDDVLRRAEDEITKHDASRTSQPRSGGGKFGGKQNNNRYQPYQTPWDRSQEAGRNPEQEKPPAWRSFSNRGRPTCGRGRGLGAPAASSRSSKQAKDTKHFK